MSEALLAILDSRPEKALAIVEVIDQQGPNSPRLNGETQFQLGRLSFQAGAEGQALDHFERALSAGFFCLACLENDPQLAALAEHPRWIAILDAAQRRQIAMVERLAPDKIRSRRDQSERQLALSER